MLFFISVVQMLAMYATIRKISGCAVPLEENDDHTIISGPLNLDSESDRLKTFTKWSNKHVDKHVLAKTGFYYLGVKDYVCCQFCKIYLKDWIDGDDEVAEHIRWSPQCPLLRKQATSNIAVNRGSLLTSLLDKFQGDVIDHHQCDCSAYLKWK